MERAIWKGFISFGLVNVPVELFPAEKSETSSGVKFHLLDQKDNSRIKYQRISLETGKEVPWDRIVKGYEYEKGSYVVLDDEDFAAASDEKINAIEIDSFVPADQLDLIYLKKPYYVVPGKNGDKGYVLLREILAKTDRVAIARVMIRTKLYLCGLLSYGEGLLLMILRYHQQIKALEKYELPVNDIKSYKITTQELKIAEQLVNSMAEDWQPENYHDHYSETINKIIEKKLHKGLTAKTKTKKINSVSKGESTDFISLLKESLQSSKPATKTAKVKPKKLRSAKKITKKQTPKKRA